MLESNKYAAIKFGIDTNYIKIKANTEKNIEILGDDLTFISVREKDRTKHVHRLHPYLGKFIPQLVEVFLRKFFNPGQSIIDPFSGSGTTLIEANVLGISSLGIELSPFNTLIQKARIDDYNISRFKCQVRDVIRRLSEI